MTTTLITIHFSVRLTRLQTNGKRLTSSIQLPVPVQEFPRKHGPKSTYNVCNKKIGTLLSFLIYLVFEYSIGNDGV